MSTSTEARSSARGEHRSAESARLPSWAASALRMTPTAAALVFVVFAARAGMGWPDMVRALIAIVLSQVIPGTLAWRAVRPPRGWLLEDLVAGLGVGAALAVAGQALAGSLQLALMAWVPAGVVTVIVLAVPSVRRRALSATTTPVPWWWGPAVSAALVPLLLSLQRFYRGAALGWEEGFRRLSTDWQFHLSIVGQLAHRGPGAIPFVEGEPLSYHWFSHAWVAQVGTTSGIPLDAALFRVGPPVLALGLVLAVAIVAVRLSGRPWAGPVAALVAVSSGDVNVFGGLTVFTGGVLTTHGALSLQFASFLAVVLVGLLSARWTGSSHPWSAALVVLLAMATAGGKGSALPLVLAGLALAFAVSLFARWPSWRAIGTDLGLVTASFVGVFLVVFGVSTRTELDPTQALSEAGISAYLLKPIEEPGLGLVVLGALLVVASVGARAAGLLAGMTLPDVRRDPMAVVLLGSTVVATLAVVVLTTRGKSQYYFLRNAIPLMAIGTSMGLIALRRALARGFLRSSLIGAAAGMVALVAVERLFPAVRQATPGLLDTTLLRTASVVLVIGAAAWIAARGDVGGRVPAGAVAAATAALALAVTPTLWSQMTSGLPEGPPAVAPTDRFAVSADQMEAARWLRDHSDVDDLVATNRHCTSPTWVNCDSRRFAVSAYTERRVLLEGYAYTRGWVQQPGGTYKPFWDEELQAVNDGFFESPSPEAARDLAQRGVQWAFVDKTTNWDPGVTDVAEPVYETEWALVLELPAAE